MAYMGSSVFSMWRMYRDKNTLPRFGGWLEQPLLLLAQIEALDLVFNTWSYIRTENSDWGKLSPTQLTIIRQVEAWQT